MSGSEHENRAKPYANPSLPACFQLRLGVNQCTNQKTGLKRDKIVTIFGIFGFFVTCTPAKDEYIKYGILAENGRRQHAVTVFMLVGIQRRDEEARHLDMKLLPLSMDELDMSMLYILRNFGLTRSLVLGMDSGIPSRSSKVDWRENSVVASVKALRDDGSDRRSDERCSNPTVQ